MLTRTPVPSPRRAPRLGEHTEAVRAALERIEARGRVEAPEPRHPGRAARGARCAGIRVLDLSQWLAGPAAAALLGDFGADVIMVELPSVAADAQGRKSPGFVVTNRNKRSITLDVRAPAGREAFLALVRVSDVIVENFRPGTLERWDLAPATLLAANPRLVLLRSSGFGQTGPYTARAAFNPVGLAFGGITYLNGWPDRPPLRDGVMAGDYTTALFNVLGMVAALLRRDLDGQGQVVDTAMFQAALRLTGDLLAVRSALGIRRERAGGDSPLFPASITVEAADGRFVAVSAPSWPDVAAALARLGRRPPPDRDGIREDVAKLVGTLPGGRRGVHAAGSRARRERGQLGGRSRPRAALLEPRRSAAARPSGDGRDRHAGHRAVALAHPGPGGRLVATAGIRQRGRARRAPGLHGRPDTGARMSRTLGVAAVSS